MNNPTNYLATAITFFILYIFSLNANAQLADRILVGAHTGITFSEYTIDADGKAGTFHGIDVELPIGSFGFSTGIEVSNYGKHYNFNYMHSNESGKSQFPSIQVTSYNFKYVGIPVRLKFNYKCFYAQVGAKMEIFQNQFPKYEELLHDPAYLDKPFYDVKNIRERNLTAEFALGVNWMPKWTNFSLYLEPTLSYMTEPIFLTHDLDSLQYSYGLKLGFKYAFKKKDFIK